MHVLIIPTEEFLPPENKTDGIFQYHQSVILKEAGYRIGLLSVKLSFSLPMVAKGVFFKLLGKKAGNTSDDHSIGNLIGLGFNKFFRPKRFVSKEVIDGLPVYRIDGLYLRPPKNNQNHLSWLRAGMACFEEYVKHEGRPDLVHAHNGLYAGMLAAEIKKKHGFTYVITEHSSIYALNEVSPASLKLVKDAYEGAAGLYAVSETFASFLNKSFSLNRFTVLPNVLEKAMENRKPERRADANEKFIFLHIGALLPVKDQRTLLKAFSQCLQQNGSAELWMAGKGELLEELKAQIASLNIGHAVKLLGLLDRDRITECFERCNCFVLSSNYETFGVVTIEAMLFGKPVITTRCGIGPAIVNDNVGFVTEVGDDEAMAQAMVLMMRQHATYDPRYIRDRVIAHFGKQTFLANITAVYKKFGAVPEPQKASHHPEPVR